MDQFQVGGLLTGNHGSQTSTGFKVDVGGGYVETYTGLGLSYDAAGHLSGGTVTGLSEAYFGAPIFILGRVGSAVAWSSQGVSQSNWPTKVCWLVVLMHVRFLQRRLETCFWSAVSTFITGTAHQ